ncbi:nuclear transport factor 2 [Silene latifolia]|uniref:nuclear transport factor 2 n=1 Tax=Silene latifolia TaxID=37657 RepID=UPI003D786FF7
MATETPEMMATEMPEMIVTETPDISDEDVGKAFVNQFYEMLHISPEHAYHFFNDSSTMSRPGPTGDSITVTTMKGIKDLILSLDCAKCKAEILTADTQASHMKGLTVLVTGFLTGVDNVRRKFTESFFLAPQNNGYFVHNDVFRFFPEDSSPIIDSVEVNCVEHALLEPVAEVAPVQETVQAQVAEISLEKHHAAVEEKSEAAPVVVVQQKPAVIERALPQPAVESNHVVQPIVEASSNGEQDAPKKSYASMLKNSKQSASAFPVHVPASPAKPVKPKAAPKTVPSPGQQTQAGTLPAAAASQSSAANRKAPSNGNASSNGHVAVKSHSIYIGHLPFDATADTVEREFNKFGRIKKNGIQVRSNKGYVFGFVEYEDASGQEKAIEMGTILIGGKDVSIEEKKTTARADDYYPSGRGGYRNDGFRRGNYSNGRGNGRNDYGNQRNGEGNFRGNRNGNGYVNQNGGGRGAPQASAAK